MPLGLHYRIPSATGRNCGTCGEAATHKAAEVLAPDAPKPYTLVHECTAYLCCHCFSQVFGPAGCCDDPLTHAATLKGLEPVVQFLEQADRPGPREPGV